MRSFSNLHDVQFFAYTEASGSFSALIGDNFDAFEHTVTFEKGRFGFSITTDMLGRAD